MVSIQGQEIDLAVRGGEIHTVSGDVIQNGVILMSGGKIRAVSADMAVPEGVAWIDASGMIVTPGIIDGRCGYGLRGSADRSRLMTPSRRVLDDFQPRSDSDWLRGGVTCVYIANHPQNLLGGLGAVVKLAGDYPVVRETADPYGSFGEGVLETFDAPTTRQAMVGRLRQELIRTREGMDRMGNTPDSTDLEVLVQILRREVSLRLYANTPDDIMTALRVAEEFGFKLIIESGAGAYKVADALAESGVPVVVGPSIMGLGGGGPYEMFAHTPGNAARLFKAGVKIALSTEGWGGGRSVLLEGVVAKSHGLPEAEALKAVTLSAAEILGVEDRLGSIETGKDADIVIWKHHPLSTWGESQVVIVDGRVVFDRRMGGS
jgi:imidazolonepropionase-like amidohydrolase